MDASVLINVVDIPKEAKDKPRVKQEMASKTVGGVKVLLPMAAIVETAQHIQRLPVGVGWARRRCSLALHKVVLDAIDGNAPWTFVHLDWDAPFVSDFFLQKAPQPNLVSSLANQTTEVGDLMLISEFRRLRASYPRSSVDMDVWTLDTALYNAIQPFR